MAPSILEILLKHLFKPFSALSFFSQTVFNGAVYNSIDTSHSCVTSVHHPISNYNHHVSIYASISDFTFGSSLGKYFSYVTIKYLPTF